MDIPDSLVQRGRDPAARTLDGWHSATAAISLDGADRDLLDLVLQVYPDLRATAHLGQVARDRGLRYPVADVEQVLEALGDLHLELGEMVVDRESVATAFAEEQFPLQHEGELLTAIQRAVVQCRVRATVRRQAAAVRSGLEVEDGERVRP